MDEYWIFLERYTWSIEKINGVWCVRDKLPGDLKAVEIEHVNAIEYLKNENRLYYEYLFEQERLEACRISDYIKLVGDRVKIRRIVMKLSRQELAKRSKLSAKPVKEIEQGKHGHPIDFQNKLESLAEVLGCRGVDLWMSKCFEEKEC